MKSKILVLLLAFAVFSCKKEEKPAPEPKAQEEMPEMFIVKLNVTVKKDDSFHLFYTEDNTINFNEKNSVWAELKGKDTPQELVFKLPESAVPTHLRMDFGVNKEQEEIVINDFKMEYFDKSFEAHGPEFFTYFYPNLECTNIDKVKGTAIPVKKGTAYTGPMFYPQIALSEKIKSMMK